MDVTVLAQNAVAALLPYLPRLLEFGGKAGEKFAEGVFKAAGEDTWLNAKAIWDRVRGAFQADTLTQSAVEQAAADPNDPLAASALAFRLREILARDPELADEVERYLESMPARNIVTASGTGAMAAGRDIKGNIIGVMGSSEPRRS